MFYTVRRKNVFLKDLVLEENGLSLGDDADLRG